MTVLWIFFDFSWGIASQITYCWLNGNNAWLEAPRFWWLSTKSFLNYFTQKLLASEKSNFWHFDRFSFFEDSRKLPCHIWEFGFNSKNGLREAHANAPTLLMRIRPKFSDTKIYGPRTSQTFFVKDFSVKSEILGSTEIAGCVNHFWLSQKRHSFRNVKFLIWWPLLAFSS